MKRQELKALLHGVENAGEIIDQIMEINGADIENAKKEKSGGNEALNREIERLKGENGTLAEQLKAYEKGGEKYIDAAEFERLKTFETDTVARQKKEKQKGAVKACSSFFSTVYLLTESRSRRMARSRTGINSSPG